MSGGQWCVDLSETFTRANPSNDNCHGHDLPHRSRQDFAVSLFAAYMRRQGVPLP